MHSTQVMHSKQVMGLTCALNHAAPNINDDHLQVVRLVHIGYQDVAHFEVCVGPAILVHTTHTLCTTTYCSACGNQLDMCANQAQQCITQSSLTTHVAPPTACTCLEYAVSGLACAGEVPFVLATESNRHWHDC